MKYTWNGLEKIYAPIKFPKNTPQDVVTTDMDDYEVISFFLFGNKSDGVQASDAFWRSARVLVTKLSFKSFKMV